ncbi:MAG: protein kinase [Candidatus Eremiobacteraeota bacterium]|nr:protein kinase [Candidatus Eremiobacteraeota bacterium]
MICPICGTSNKEDTVKCTKCGLILSPGKIGALRKAEENLRTSKKKKVSSRSFPMYLGKGRYLVKKKLASGGMSRVLLAKDSKMDCFVVVKEMLPFFQDDKDAEYLVNRFQEEAKLLYRLDHPRLPKVKDYFTEEDRLYFIMQYIDGKTLAKIALNRPGQRIKMEEGLKWMMEVIEILSYLHNQDPPVIHRDIKPHNIMLDKSKRIYLVDFGIAREVTGQAGTGTTVGTFGYASPEHFTGKFLFSSDLYSLGATFHMLLSGSDPRERPPFEFPPLSEYRNDIPPGLEEIFNRLLQKDRKKRYRTVNELKKDYYTILSGVHRRKGKTRKKRVGVSPDSGTIRLQKEKMIPLEYNTSGVEILSRNPDIEKEDEKRHLPLFTPRSPIVTKARRVTKIKGKKKEKNSEEILEEILKKQKEKKEALAEESKTEGFAEKIKPHLIPLILIGLVILASMGFIMFYVWKSFIAAKKERIEYQVKAYSKSEKAIFKMKDILKNTKYKPSTQKVKKYIKKKSGFRVYQTFKDQDAARRIAKYLSSKGITTKVIEDPDEGIIVRLGGTFRTRREAQRYANRAQGVMPLIFKVSYNYHKIPYTTYRLTLSGIATKEEAKKIKKEFSKLTHQIVIEEKVIKE